MGDRCRVAMDRESEQTTLFPLFVDNLPENVVLLWFRKFFNQFGVLKDAFILVKCSKVTKRRFGFVRYNCATSKSKGFWIEDRKLFVKFAAFGTLGKKPLKNRVGLDSNVNTIGGKDNPPSLPWINLEAYGRVYPICTVEEQVVVNNLMGAICECKCKGRDSLVTKNPVLDKDDVWANEKIAKDNHLVDVDLCNGVSKDGVIRRFLSHMRATHLLVLSFMSRSLVIRKLQNHAKKFSDNLSREFKESLPKSKTVINTTSTLMISLFCSARKLKLGLLETSVSSVVEKLNSLFAYRKKFMNLRSEAANKIGWWFSSDMCYDNEKLQALISLVLEIVGLARIVKQKGVWGFSNIFLRNLCHGKKFKSEAANKIRRRLGIDV
ncbi:hypothetical protein RHMOL_Rhmol02G0088100 [Rhododendron molle]|uniref:Uncharacterized protein n=1 Tax=Rhododendron molle TaxID=49168 RepID=A0ACC0PN26_RHOML|nr:hypothetical protein RHMOL_Rhmol02G0088100 [Rhododendron molle]